MAQDNPFAEFVPQQDDNPFAEFLPAKKKLGDTSLPNYLMRKPAVVSGGYIPDGIVQPSQFVESSSIPDALPLDDKMQPVRDFLKNPDTGKIRETRISSGSGVNGDPFVVSDAFNFDDVYNAAPNGAVFKTPDGEIVERKASPWEMLAEPFQSGLEAFVGGTSRIAGDFLNIPNDMRSRLSDPNYKQKQEGYPESVLPVDQNVGRQFIEQLMPLNFGDPLNEGADTMLTSANDRMAKVTAGTTPLRGSLSEMTSQIASDPENVARQYGPQVVRSLPTMLGAMTGNPAAAAGIAGASTGIEIYGQDRLQGMDMATSAQDAGVQGIIETLAEKLPLDAVFKPSTNPVAKALRVAGTETASEGLTGPSQYAASQAVQGKEIDPEQLQNSLVDSLAAGLGMSGPMASVGAAVDVNAKEKPNIQSDTTKPILPEKAPSPPVGEATADQSQPSKAMTPSQVEPTADLDAALAALPKEKQNETGRNVTTESQGAGSPVAETANPEATSTAPEYSAPADSEANAPKPVRAINEAATQVNRLAELETKSDTQDLSPDESVEYAKLLKQDRIAGKVGGRVMPGVKNSTAYTQAKDAGQLKPVQTFLDADNFKRINDELNHDAGDEAIAQIGQALFDELGEGNVFHRSGDEFIVQGDDPAVIDAAMARARDRLSKAKLQVTLPDGTVIERTGIGFSYGSGKDITEAENAQRTDKENRAAAGLRTERRADSRRVDSGANQAPVTGRPQESQSNNDAAAEAVNNDTPPPDIEIKYGKRREASATQSENTARAQERVNKQFQNAPKFQSKVATDTVSPTASVNLRSVAERVTAGWKGSPRINSVATAEQLPDAVKQYAESNNVPLSEIAAVWHNGEVHLVESHPELSTEIGIEKAIYHEVWGHHGLRLAKHDELRPYLLRLAEDMGGAPGLLKYATDNNIDLGDYDKSLKESGASRIERLTVLADELISHLAENGPPRIKQRIKEYLGAIKQWLAAHGFPKLAKLSDLDLAYLMKQSREAVINGRPETSEGTAFQRKAEIDQTETPEFKKWFGDSKVVDADGKPLVVYHGTGADFSEFKVDGAGKTSGSGAFFTDNSKTADTYAVGDSPSVSPVFLSLKYPVIVDAQGQNWSKIKQSAKVYLPEIAAVTKSMQLDEDLLAALEDRKPEKLNPVKSKEKNTSVKSLFKNELDYSDDTVSTDDLARWARQNGYDGIIIKNVMDRGPSGRFSSDEAQKPSTLYVAFNPSQIKSATGNSGAFDPNNPNILFSRKPAEAAADAEAKRAEAAQSLPVNRGTAGWNYDSSVWEGRTGQLNRARAALQDKMLAWRDVQNQIESKLGEALPDAQNVYRMETLMHGRVSEAINQVEQAQIIPLIDAMKAAKVTNAQLEEYLYARHAKERNAQVASINPKMPDGGSGMSDVQAQAILDKADKAKLEPLAKRVDAITRATRKRLLDSGLITQEQHDGMAEQYKAYMPLRGKKTTETDFETSGGGAGRGIDSRSQPVKGALGRGTGNLAENILAEIIGDAHRSVIVAEKARVGRAVMRLVLANPSPNLWTIEPVQTERKLDANGEVYDAVINDWSDPSIVAVRHKGKLYKVEIQSQPLAQALNNVGVDQLGMATKVAGTINRYFSAVLTKYNPAFVPVNATRDALFGLTGLAVEKGELAALDAAIHYPQAAFASFQQARNKFGTGEWAKWADEFAQAGGKTGYVAMPSVEDLARQIGNGSLSSYSPSGLTKAARTITDAVGVMNDAVENALRLSAFVTLRKRGESTEKAAEYAKNMTVNFNRKGFDGSKLNAWFLFYNASIQGAHRTSKILRNPKAYAYLGMLAGIQVVATMFAMGLKGDDDEPLWNKVPDHVKRRNIVIVTPDSGVITIPMPYGFNLFPYIAGRISGALMNKEAKPEDSAASIAGDVMSAATESFSPVPLDDGALGLLPTVLRIPVNLQTNRNDFGQEIRKENPYSKFDVPRASMGKPDTLEVFKMASTGLNRLGGGDEYTPPPMSWLDVAPEDIQYLLTTLTGGTGKFVVDVASVGQKLAGPEPIKISDVPITKRFVSQIDEQAAQQSMFYNRAETINRSLEKVRDHFERTSDLESTKKMLASFPELKGAGIKVRKKEGEKGEPAGSAFITDGRIAIKVTDELSVFGLYKSAEKAITAINEGRRNVYAKSPASILSTPETRLRDKELARLKEDREQYQKRFNAAWQRDVVGSAED